MPFGIVRFDQVGHLRRLQSRQVGDLEVLGIPLDLFTPVAHFAVGTAGGGRPHGEIAEQNGLGQRPGPVDKVRLADLWIAGSLRPEQLVHVVQVVVPFVLGLFVIDLDLVDTLQLVNTAVIVGAVKYRFIGPLLNQLTYSGLLLDGHPHFWIDLPVSAIAYYLYLYCNFSGFCDIAIGAAGMMGISVAENFNHPLTSRNLKDFWNRWHITLSQYMRDIVFTPLSKTLVRLLGPNHANEAIAITIMVVFLLVGIWHGVGWHYAAFGAAHGIGLTVHHYYSVALKKRLGREGFAAYNQNRIIHIFAVMLTFSYVTACLFLFANDGAAMFDIYSALRLNLNS